MEKLQLLPVLNSTITHIYLKCNMMLVILKCNMMLVIINAYISNSLISLITVSLFIKHKLHQL